MWCDQKQRVSNRERTGAPKDDCLKCGDPQYVVVCPTATLDEKKELPKHFHTSRQEKIRMKRIKEKLGGVNAIMLNNVLELQYCADTGSDRCLLSRNNFKELVRLDNSVKLITLITPIIGKAVGGHEVKARDYVKILIRLHAAAGSVEPAEPVTCLITEQDDDEFIVGNDVLRSLGIDVDRQLEQLAGGKFNDEDPFDRDDDVFFPGHATDADISEGLEKLLDAALQNGFPRESIDELRRITSKHDIWRLTLRDDPPAKIPPYELRLKKDAKPFRCKARQYAPLQSTFLRDFNKKLVELVGLGLQKL